MIVQPGASDAGPEFAAETAEAMFTARALSPLDASSTPRESPDGKAERSHDYMKILPACFVVVGNTVEEAREKRARLDGLVITPMALPHCP